MGDSNGLSGPTDGRSRRLPLRTVLLIVVFVPSVTFAPLLASGMFQLSSQWQTEKAQMELATTTVGRPAANLFFSLQEERRLTAEAQAEPRGGARDKLAKQRAVTDQAVKAFPSPAALDTTNAQEGLTGAITRFQRGLGLLDQQRGAVDAGWASEQLAFDYYSGVIEADLSVLTALSHTHHGEVGSKAQTLVDLFWVVDMIGREDAVLARGWKSGRLTKDEYALVTDAIGTRKHILQSQVLPSLLGNESQYRTLTTSKAWDTMTGLEKRLVTSGTGTESNQVILRDVGPAWRASVDIINPQLLQLLSLRLDNVATIGNSHARTLFVIFVSVSAVSLLAFFLVVFTSWRLTAVLRRRILHLREEAQELQERLPDVVARLERGEDVDVDAEVHMVEPTPDELGELGQALNLASRSAVLTAVRQAEQHRGFQRMLQRIARRTQILIGLQLKKLDELERRHEDPEVLEGLFDLDHLTARLRRYEENLVILGGGQPQRRWRKPVRLLDVLRAAQGEVQDYRRISIEVAGEPWVAERAVGPLVHVLAELMENATAFSKPPTPVEVRAALVSRGLAVEIEDRGLGMEPEQYAAANDLMQSPPQLDVMTHADDVRLGLYVVARLSAGLGLQVELRPSAFGGTRVIVLLPESLVVDRPRAVPEPVATPREEAPREPAGPQPHPREAAPGPRPPREGAQLPTRSRGRAMAYVTAPGAGAPDRGEEPPPPGPRPLPQRVRQASLVTELKVPVDREEQADQGTWPAREQPGRSSAMIGAFQRQSRRRRTGDDDASQPRPDGSAEPSSPTTEDR
ncbi:nitrate- and nitrite sensing domain-containing protein [Nonomuraea sp. 3-1Str]|uniref:sensor histidine kinase n=1 Tax=Nonomuraea sp. 3-1Str TaxID=2929801 RepID=UPI00285E48A0|nr:nitrate- and nitrite sensing domain-containing protein [Nonomuraea sp. 3-1Str]MDR8407972.1 nitrate- and nitrite sensing domain-containing protein [Nonomuraea sp. 3-1Str]